jgi:hypothetical protein
MFPEQSATSGEQTEVSLMIIGVDGAWVVELTRPNTTSSRTKSRTADGEKEGGVSRVLQLLQGSWHGRSPVEMGFHNMITDPWDKESHYEWLMRKATQFMSVLGKSPHWTPGHAISDNLVPRRAVRLDFMFALIRLVGHQVTLFFAAAGDEEGITWSPSPGGCLGLHWW